MEWRLIDLPWLTEPPPDFYHQVRSLSAPSQSAREIARRLSGSALAGNRLFALGKAIDRVLGTDVDVTRLGVLSNASADLLVPAITASALRHGVWMKAIGTAYDQVAAEALDPNSSVNRAQCDFVLIAVDHRGLGFTTENTGDLKGATQSVNAALEYVDGVRSALRQSSDCTVIVQTVPQVTGTLFGSLERTVPGTVQWLIDRYNRELRSRIVNSPDLLLDTAALAEAIGLSVWHDQTQWHLGKFPASHSIVPLYAEWVARVVAVAQGRARKCLVLDLDNTLWGGIVGDDGLNGLVLGNGSPAGEAYLEVQRTALALRDRGVILAVLSKNEQDIARSVFRLHPEMLLKEEHIAVFQANWQDKASNLRAIAQMLNIGIDSLVLLDDSAAERAQVRHTLPEVAVPELPSDPTFYAETLLAAGYFEALAFTDEDRRRAELYRQNAARVECLGAASDLESYLRSLQMKAICGAFDSVGRSRISQLINKTNQFNLTTRRYTEADIKKFEQSSPGLTLQVRLVDRFGDNGIVALVICVDRGDWWEIDTWVMSCRVFNRGVERAMLNRIVECARAANVSSLVGRYFRTERNGIVKDLYPGLGFSPVSVSDDAGEWHLNIASYIMLAVPIQVVDSHPGSTLY